MKRTVLQSISIAILSTGVLFAGPVFAGELDAIIESCADCHGDNGVSQWDDVPTIAGIDAFVGSEALYIYRDEARPCASIEYKQGDTSRPAANMCEISKDLSDDSIEAIAEHFMDLPFVAATQAFDSDLAEVGKAIHDRDCGMCHTDGGSNPADESSILAGQWMGYLEISFAEFLSGERDQPPRMKQSIDALNSADVQALLHYYASQQ